MLPFGGINPLYVYRVALVFIVSIDEPIDVAGNPTFNDLSLNRFLPVCVADTSETPVSVGGMVTTMDLVGTSSAPSEKEQTEAEACVFSGRGPIKFTVGAQSAGG